MTGYYITFAQALRDSYVTMFLAGIGMLLLIAAVISWWLMKSHMRSMMTVTTAMIGLIMLAVTIWLPWSITGTGWSVSSGQSSGQSSDVSQSVLTVNTGFGKVEWPLAGVVARYVTNDTQYRPVLRTGGYGGSQLQTGHFRLANGDNVLLFRYGTHRVLLLRYVGSAAASSQSQSHADVQPAPYAKSPQPDIILSSPNVDRLYAAIITATKGQPMPPRTGPLPISTGVEAQNVIAALIVALTSVAVQVWLSVRFLPVLPAMVSSHWNFKGEVDGHMSKRVIVWIGPIVATVFGAISVGLAFTPSSLFLQVPFWLVQALFIYVTWWMYQRNLNRS